MDYKDLGYNNLLIKTNQDFNGINSSNADKLLSDGAVDWDKISNNADKPDAGATNNSASFDGDNLITDVINDRLDTSSRYILQEFTFSPSDYSGAFKTGDITWSTTTGAITSGSGLVINKSGIIGAKNGTATFSIDTNGDATFSGDITGSTGTFGSVTINSGSISWSTVGGTGVPDDNATYGATFGTNISGGSTGTNYVNNSGYMTKITGTSITTGTITVDPVNSKIEALVVKKGGDIFIEGDASNPGELVFRDGANISKYWRFYMDVDATADFLYLIPNSLTYRDFFIGKFGSSGTDEEQTATALRNFFVNTGNTLSGVSRPSIILQNWNAYSGKFSRLAIGDSDSDSLVEIKGDFIPDDDATYNLGSSSSGWSRLYLANSASISTSSSDTFISLTSTNGISMAVGRKIRIGITDYGPTTLNYKDHSGVNQTMEVLAYEV